MWRKGYLNEKCSLPLKLYFTQNLICHKISGKADITSIALLPMSQGYNTLIVLNSTEYEDLAVSKNLKC